MILQFFTLLILASAACCIASSASSINDPYQAFQKIDSRSSTCSDPTATQCGPEFPSNFCCPQADSCVNLAGNTTLLCCPAGYSCSTIRSISCDITQQNVTAHPGVPLMTTELSATLPACATQCCPFGYSCDSNNDCALNDLQNQDNFTSSTAAPTSSLPTETSSLPRPSTSASLAPTISSANPLSTIVTGQNFTPNVLVTGDETTVNSDSVTITVAAGSTAAVVVIMLWALLFWRISNYRRIQGRKRQSMYWKAELDASSMEERQELSTRSLDAHELLADRVAFELDGTPIFATRGGDLKPLPDPPRRAGKVLVHQDQNFLGSFKKGMCESTDSSGGDVWM